jgi:hypothetical protein
MPRHLCKAIALHHAHASTEPTLNITINQSDCHSAPALPALSRKDYRSPVRSRIRSLGLFVKESAGQTLPELARHL